MARKRFEKLLVEFKFDPNEIDEDTILSDLEDHVQSNYGKDVIVKAVEEVEQDDYEEEDESEYEDEEDSEDTLLE